MVTPAGIALLDHFAAFATRVSMPRYCSIHSLKSCCWCCLRPSPGRTTLFDPARSRFKVGHGIYRLVEKTGPGATPSALYAPAREAGGNHQDQGAHHMKISGRTVRR